MEREMTPGDMNGPLLFAVTHIAVFRMIPFILYRQKSR